MFQAQRRYEAHSNLWPSESPEVRCKCLCPYSNYTRMDKEVNTRLDRHVHANYARMYSPGMTTIGTRLDEAMREAGFESQSALARASKVPQPTINRILKGGGERGPEAGTVRKLAEACNVSFEWLNEGIGEKKRASLRLAHSNDVALEDETKVDATQLLELIDLFRRSTPAGRQFILDSAEGAEKIEGSERLVQTKQV